jgi:hypothetical protein
MLKSCMALHLRWALHWTCPRSYLDANATPTSRRFPCSTNPGLIGRDRPGGAGQVRLGRLISITDDGIPIYEQARRSVE